MAENGLNSRRTLWAREYQSAPRKRWFATTQVTVVGGTPLDITALCPTKADCGGAPYFDFFCTTDIDILEAGLLGVGMSHAAATIPVIPQYPYVAEEETEGIRVLGLFPLAAAGDTVLDTPMIDASGVDVPNKLYLINGDAQTEVLVQIIFEIPNLDWV